MKPKAWNERDDSMLTELYKYASIRLIAERLGRNVGDVSDRIAFLNLAKKIKTTSKKRPL